MAILYAWDGDCFKPATEHWAREADKQFVVGQNYRLEVREPRSTNSHRHFFVTINAAWENLPEHLAERFRSPEALRKWCLIKAGFRNERSIACSSPEEAHKVASFIRPLDEFSVTVVNESVVTIYTAQSQSSRNMGKDQFQKSKTACLDVLAELIGTPAESLSANATAAA